ncbi:MAG: M20 metallopeptidase family protein [Anaerolineae bacterium]
MDPLQEANLIYDQLVAWRRDLHRHPELGLDTERTAAIVADKLRELGYAVQEGIAKNGVIGLLENGEGAVVMHRADMDALPIQEENDVDYASEHPGRMHACGHDSHVAMGLGIATLMAEHRDAWQGTLKLIFQPGEEAQNGAEIMVKEGALEDPRPDAALAVHIWNYFPYGSIGVTSGPVMAAAEAWKATIVGRGGHGAMPDDTVDPVVTAALTVANLQTIVSRNVSALDTAVVTVGSIQSGDAFNVIPERAVLKGTVRTYDEGVRATVLRRLREVVEGTAQTMGARAEFEMMPLTPALVNDEEVTALVRDVVVDLLGAEAVSEMRTMGSEDFSFFLDEVPGCYIFVMSGPEDYQDRPHHSPRFDIVERAMVDGVAVIVEALTRLMPPAGPDGE